MDFFPSSRAHQVGSTRLARASMTAPRCSVPLAPRRANVSLDTCGLEKSCDDLTPPLSPIFFFLSVPTVSRSLYELLFFWLLSSYAWSSEARLKIGIAISSNTLIVKGST